MAGGSWLAWIGEGDHISDDWVWHVVKTYPQKQGVELCTKVYWGDLVWCRLASPCNMAGAAWVVPFFCFGASRHQGPVVFLAR